MSKSLGMQLYLKKDYLQKTGSFKERGARYSVIKLSDEHKKNGVITTSAGNHAQVVFLKNCYRFKTSSRVLKVSQFVEQILMDFI